MGEEAATQAQIYLNKKEYREYLEYAPIKFQADGMSRVAGRMKEMDKVMAWINLLANAGKAIPQILQQVNWREILEMGAYCLDWDPTKVLSPGPGEEPTKPVPGPENPAMATNRAQANGNGAPQDRSPTPPGIPETAGSVPGMASMSQAFKGFQGQNEIPGMGGSNGGE
jgi:hypothetical protein